MKVCLINPPRLLAKTSITLRSTPPLGLAYLAGSLIKAGHEVQVIDAIAEDPNRLENFHNYENAVLHGASYNNLLNKIDSDVELIGLSCMFSQNWLSNRELIDLLGNQRPKSTIIIGGEHATSVPKLCLKQTEHLDACALGEGEETIVDIANSLSRGMGLEEVSGIVYRTKDGDVIETPPRKRIRKLDEIPWPKWNIFPVNTYLTEGFSYGVDLGKTLPIMASRGCPYRCTFCSSPQMWGVKYSLRSIPDIVEEIKFLQAEYQISNFDFFDLTAIINKRWIIEFCQALINEGITMTWQIPAGTRSEVIDQKVARYLYQSGCRNITYAPESGAPEVLQMIKKKVDLDRMLDSIQSSHKEGLNIKLNMIIGFPGETHKHVWQTIWYLVKCSWYGAHDSVPSIFSPYPGSELYKQLSGPNVDIDKDEYFMELLNCDTYVDSPTYNPNMSTRTILIYSAIQFLVFYSSNYLFRPQRLLRTIRNLINGKYESRAELTLGELLKRKKTKLVEAQA